MDLSCASSPLPKSGTRSSALFRRQGTSLSPPIPPPHHFLPPQEIVSHRLNQEKNINNAVKSVRQRTQTNRTQKTKQTKYRIPRAGMAREWWELPKIEAKKRKRDRRRRNFDGFDLKHNIMGLCGFLWVPTSFSYRCSFLSLWCLGLIENLCVLQGSSEIFGLEFRNDTIYGSERDGSFVRKNTAPLKPHVGTFSWLNCPFFFFFCFFFS